VSVTEIASREGDFERTPPHDLAAPRLRARMDVFDGSVWHALIPGVPHLVRQCHSAVAVSGGVAAWLTGVSAAIQGTA